MYYQLRQDLMVLRKTALDQLLALTDPSEAWSFVLVLFSAN
jgi:hypothetical protein